MENMSNMQVIPEQNISESKGIGMVGVPAVDTSLGLTNDTFAEDMAKLRAEAEKSMVVAPPETSVPMTPPTTPEQPVEVEQAPVTQEATKTEVKVPEKFQTPDGKIDEAKVAKSLMSAEETLAKYLEKEKELKRKMNEMRAKENAYLNPPTQIAAQPQSPINPNFEKQIEEDIAKEGVGRVLTKLFSAAQEAAYEKTRLEIDQVKAVSAEMTTKQQIEAIAKNDPWVYSQEGVATLTRILDNQPYLWQANDPYKAAYTFYKGQNVASQMNPQVLTPTPQARPSAPIPTGQAAVPSVQAPIVKLNTREDIDSHLKKLTPAQQSEFFKKMGLPGF